MAAAVLAGLTALATAAPVQILTPGLCGFTRLALPGNSDSIVAVPFTRPAAGGGLVQGAAGSVITAQGTTGWAAHQFEYVAGTQADTFYVLVLSGTLEGASYRITGNTATTVTVDAQGDNLSALAAGTRFAVIPYWTLGTLFPQGRGVNASVAGQAHASEVFFPDVNAAVINPAPARTFFFQDGRWMEGEAIADDVVIPPSIHLTVRHNVAAATELLCAGEVITTKLRVPIVAKAAAKHDNFLGLQRPNNVTLAASELITSGAFQASPSVGVHTDELLVFNNATVQKNKSAAAIYFYWNNAWRKTGAGAATFDATQIFTPGTGFIIRKNAGASSPIWTNAPGY